MMAEAVTYLHDKLFIIHRELHLENFIISAETGHIVLTDFSTAKCIGEHGYEEFSE
jgi:serine/threonine protein kinase